MRPCVRGFHSLLVIVALALLLPACSPSINHRPEGREPSVFFPGNQDVIVSWRAKISDREPMDFEPLESGIAGVDEQAVYVGGRSHRLFRLDRKTGKVLAKRKLKEEIFSQPLVVGSIVYLGTSSGTMHAMDKHSLEDLWTYQTSSEIVAPCTHHDGILYFVSLDDTLTALDAQTGAFKWEHREEYHGTLSIRRRGQPVVDGNSVFQGFTSGTFCAFDRVSGELLWRRNLGSGKRFDDANATPVVYQGLVYTASFDNAVYCLNAESGQMVWKNDIKSASSGIIIKDKLYLTSSEDGFYCLDLETGSRIWDIKLDALYRKQPEGVLSKPYLFKDRYLVLSSSGSGIYFVDYIERKLIKRFTPGNGNSAPPTVLGDHIYALSNGGYLYAITLGKKGSPFTPYK